MSNGVIKANPTIAYGKVTEGTIPESTQESPSTAFNIEFGKTFSSPPFVMAHVYPQTRFADRTIYITTIASITTTGCVINVVNPYTAEAALNSTRCIEWLAIG